jgi:hypothetical protein
VISVIYFFIYGLGVSGNAPAALLSRKRAEGTVVYGVGLDTVVRYLWDFECSPVIRGRLSFLSCFTVYKNSSLYPEAHGKSVGYVACFSITHGWVTRKWKCTPGCVSFGHARRVIMCHLLWTDVGQETGRNLIPVVTILLNVFFLV